MRKLYEFGTSAGTVHIAEQYGHFFGLLNGERITGRCKTPEHAARDLAAGQFDVDGLDASIVSVPVDLSRWRALSA